MSEEQTEQTQEQQPAEAQGADGASRDDLIAAVREAGGTASVDVAAEEEAAKVRTEGLPAPAAETPPPAEEEPRIAAILKAREQKRAEQEAARNTSQEMIERARQESERLLAEAREAARREIEAERERYKQEFRSNPTATLRQLGDPQTISDLVMREGTPEAREAAQIRQELAEAKKLATEGAEAVKKFEAYKQEQAQIAQQARVDAVKAQFLTQAASDKAPYLNARYEPEEIFLRGDRLALEWQRGGLVLGQDFDFGDIVQYLELDSKKRLAAIGASPASPVSAGTPAQGPGPAVKVSANGQRTLSAATGSERRVSPRPLTELKPAEARQALIDEVAAARKANPDAVF
jgi:hypothetical protein